MENAYDIVIVGGGIAGLTAALYALRARLHVVVVEKRTIGGSIVDANLVENFPCFPRGISGSELIKRLVSQVRGLGLEFKKTQVTEIKLRDNLKWVCTEEADYCTPAIIIASGARPRKLGIPGEDEFIGRGIHYCAICDGNAFIDGEVAIIGGGDSGVTGGLHMTRIASKVILIEIQPQLGATAILQERLYANPKVSVLCLTELKAIVEDGGRKRLEIKNLETGGSSELIVDGVFVYVGIVPNTDICQGIVDLDSTDQIVANSNMETSVEGIFAAGDVRSNSPRQALTAAADGATAALAAERYLTSRPN
jgi:thioredoxin reductase (NADPH)